MQCQVCDAGCFEMRFALGFPLILSSQHCLQCALLQMLTVQCTLHNKQFKVNAMFLLQCNRHQVNQHPATRTSTRFKWDIWDVLGCTMYTQEISQGNFDIKAVFKSKDKESRVNQEGVSGPRAVI